MKPSIDALYSAVRGLCASAAVLPEAALSPEERRALGPYRAREAEALVRAVARALASRPELFPDAPAAPGPLRDGLGRARAYERLEGVLSRLAACAHDQALLERAAAVQGAMSVVEQVRRTGALPSGFPEQAAREAALRVAEQVLAQRQARRRQAAGRRGSQGSGAA